MDTEALKKQLAAHIDSLQHQGLIDNYFRSCHSLKDNGLLFFADLVPSFFTDFRAGLNQMTTILNQADVDYHDLYEHCIKLLGSAGCIGARRVRKACSNLRQAIDDRSKDGCILAMNNIKHEYHNLQSQMEPILQLEREIVSRETRKP